jgi:alpha-galactosidase
MLRVMLAMVMGAVAVVPCVGQGVGAKPYMGWSSWSLIRGGPTEDKILAQADALKANGLDKVGYQYVNVDDGWQDGYGPDALPKVKTAAFPHGIDGLAKAIHERGLKFGIYLNPGIRMELWLANPVIAGTQIHVRDITDVDHAGSTRNSAKQNNPKLRAFRIDFSKPGAEAYVQAEAAQLAGWGVDFLKLDFVGPGGGDQFADNREELRQWHRAIAKAGRPIWLELSNFMSVNQAEAWRATANGWRIENDIECYECSRGTDETRKGNLTEWSKVVTRFADVRAWSRYAGVDAEGKGGWNDLDTLELGNGDKDGITVAERQSMFAFWAISCAPLYLGSDLTKMDAEDLALIKNERLIAIDQAGVAAEFVDFPGIRRQKDLQMWATKYPDGSLVVAVFNLGAAEQTAVIPLDQLDAVIDTNLKVRGRATDVMTGATVETPNGGLQWPIEPHGVRVLRWAGSK